MATLLEMFPACCKVEAIHCLTIMGGDLQRAAQMILNRAEMGEDIKLTQAQLLAQLSRPVKIDETEVKKKIMDSYGFVDTEVDQKYHRPTLKKGVGIIFSNIFNLIFFLRMIKSLSATEMERLSARRENVSVR